MKFNNYQYLKSKEMFILALLISLSILIRVPMMLIFGDTALENEWKVLVDNLIIHGKLSFRNLDGFLLPNLYMPPLYAFYLYFFSFFNFEDQNYIQLILSSQILLSSISVAVFYKINKLFFSEKISFYSSLLFSFFPIHVYASGQISSISLQIFLTILFFYFLFKFIDKRNIFSIILISFTSGLLLLLRGEFILIVFFSFIYLLVVFKISIKKIFLIFLVTLITISPYLIRNVNTFNTITITKTFGYNLWKGNNFNSKVEGSELISSNLQKKIDTIPKDINYQINLDKVFLTQAIDNITKDPTRYLVLYVKKFISFLLIDTSSSQPNYFNPLHYLPVLLLGITSLIGIILSDKKLPKLNYLILVFFIYVFLFSAFFILPRYNLVIIPLQIIFTNVLIQYINKKFLHRYGQSK